MVISLDYLAYDGRMVQDWQFSNYKKFQRAAATSHEKRYIQASNFLGQGVKGLQRGVDMIEDIPGISNMKVSVFDYAIGKTQHWT